MSSILILFLISYLILAKIRLDWAVMLLIAALPSYLIRFQVLGIPFTLLEAMIFISFAVWAIVNRRELIANIRQTVAVSFGRLRRSGGFIRYPFDIEIILMLIISFVAIAIAGFSDSALGIWKAYFFEPVLVFILVMNVFGKRQNFPEDEIHFKCDIPECRLQNEFIQPLKKILWPLTISAFAISVLAIYQKFTGAFIFNELWAAEETRRVVSFFGYPNAVGLYLGPIVMVMMGFFLHEIKKIQDTRYKIQTNSKLQITNNKFTPLDNSISNGAGIQNSKCKIIFIAVVILASLLSIYFAKSEGALIGVAAGILLFCLLAGKKIRWAAVTLIFIAGIGIIMFQPARDYAIKKITLRDLSGEIRKQQWKETWQMMASSPTRFIFGTGLANYQSAIKPYHQEGIFFNKDNDPEFHRHVVWNEEYKKSHWQPVEVYLYPHNILLNFWTELGLAGMLLFVWIIGKFFVIGINNFRKQKTENRKQKYITLGLIGAMVVIVVHGLVDVPYFKNDLAAMFWVFVAMLGMINLKCLKEKND